MSFSEKVKAIRINAALSQDSFAKLLGVSRATVNRWEMGTQEPSQIALHILNEYCEKNGISLDAES